MFRSAQCGEIAGQKASCVAMLGTDPATMGGISTVIRLYRDAGLFQRWPMVYISTHRDGGPVFKFMAACRGLCQFSVRLITGRVKLVHVHVASHASFWRKYVFVHLAYLFRIPVILHLHGGGFAEFYDKECGWLRRRMIRETFDSADRILVLSESWSRWMRGMTANPNILVVPNPVKVPGRHCLPDRAEPTLLFLGRMIQQKGTYDLLAAIAALAPEFPGLKLIAAGSGETDIVRQRAAELGILESLELPGWVNGADKARLFERASVFVLPSYFEGLPMGILEAMATGLPVVSTTVGGIPEVVRTGVEGYLVSPGDVAALTAALKKLLGDPELRHRMGEAANLRAKQQYSLDVVVPLVESIYCEFGISPLQRSQPADDKNSGN